MAWLTTEIEIDGKRYTAREPSCAAYDRLVTSKPEDGTYGESAVFVCSCLSSTHPEITADQVLAGMPPRELGKTVKALMALSGAEEPKPGEPPSA